MKTACEIFYEQQEKEDEAMLRTIQKINREELNEIVNQYQKRDKVIDLHTHTNYSDGDLDPNELIRLAIEKDIGTLAITDHDTIAGLKEIDYDDPLIVKSGIKIINGMELSVKAPKGRMHILGYDLDINDENLNQKMSDLKLKSLNSMLSVMLQAQRDYGIVFKYDDIKKLINSHHNLGRPDLAKLCVKYGLCKTVQEAFDKYLIAAYDKVREFNKNLSYEECIDLITKSKGIPVLAHPKSLGLNEAEFLNLLERMISAGLQGIEVYHYTHTSEEAAYFLNIAEKYNLLVSGGTDFHGASVKPEVELGSGKNGNVQIKELSILKRIRK